MDGRERKDRRRWSATPLPDAIMRRVILWFASGVVAFFAAPVAAQVVRPADATVGLPRPVPHRLPSLANPVGESHLVCEPTDAVVRFVPAPVEQQLRHGPRLVSQPIQGGPDATDLQTPDRIQGIVELTNRVRPEAGDFPRDLAAAEFAAAGQVYQGPGAVRMDNATGEPWLSYVYWWDAPATCHNPLYFEDVNLERYGYSWGMAQPLVSGAHFFGTIPTLPYRIVAEPPRECIYTLGHYRPGSCVPYQVHRPPLSCRGGVAEAAAAVGLIFLLP